MAIVTDSLRGYWHFQQGISGNTWSNIAPTTTGSYNGTITGAVTQVDGEYFDGVDDRVTFPNLGITGKSFTLEIKGKYSGASGFLFISGFTHRLGFLNSNSVQALFNGGGFINTSTGVITSGNFYHLTFRYDFAASKEELFINGVSVGSRTSATSTNLNATFSMAYDPVNSTIYSGVIPFLRIYDKALSNTEITQNINEGNNIGLSGGSSGTAHTASLSDSVAFSETLAKISSRNKSLADSIGSAETFSKRYQGFRSINDAVTNTDNFNKAFSGYMSLSDSVSSIDTISKQLSVAVIDTVSTGDAENDKTNKGLSDAISGTDTLSKLLQKAINDSVGTSDGIVQQGGNSANLSDYVTITDTIRKALVKYQSDSVATDETNSEKVTKQLLDTLTQSDSLTTTKGKTVVLSESLTVADSLAKAISRLQSDSVGLSEVFAKQTAVSVNLYDVLVTTDSLTTYLPNVPEYREVITIPINLSTKQTVYVSITQRQVVDIDITQRYKMDVDL